MWKKYKSKNVDFMGNRYNVTPIFEPIWDNDNKIIAFELLSRFKCIKTKEALPPETFFKYSTHETHCDIFLWQLKIVSIIKEKLISKNIIISINITKSSAHYLLNNDIGAKISPMSLCTALEVNENFFTIDSFSNDIDLLYKLRMLAPIWLDDFGKGSSTLTSIFYGHFNRIKIDGNIINYLVNLSCGNFFLQAFSALASEHDASIIVEGISDIDLANFSFNNGVSACQGWLLKSMTYEQLLDFLNRPDDIVP